MLHHPQQGHTERQDDTHHHFIDELSGPHVLRDIGIFRYVDQKNFYVMTAGCPSDFLALNRVTNGEVIVLKQQVSPVDKNTWYHLKLIAKEDHLAAYNGDKFMFEVTDSKIRKGRIGLWAQADAQPRFDNVKLTLPMKEIPMAAPMPAPMPAPAMPAPGMPAPAKPAAGKPAMPVPAKPVAPAKPGAAAKHIAPAPVRRPLPLLPPAPGAGASGAAMPQTPPPR